MMALLFYTGVCVDHQSRGDSVNDDADAEHCQATVFDIAPVEFCRSASCS